MGKRSACAYPQIAVVKEADSLSCFYIMDGYNGSSGILSLPDTNQNVCTAAYDFSVRIFYQGIYGVSHILGLIK